MASSTGKGKSHKSRSNRCKKLAAIVSSALNPNPSHFYPSNTGVVHISPAQAASKSIVTTDIVWLVEQTITLADGSRVKALVPQLYVKVQPGDLDGSGTLIAGKDVNINVTGDVTNTGTIAGSNLGSVSGSVAGSVAGRRLVNITANNLQNLGGRITGDAVTVNARNDLNNIGGQIDAASNILRVRSFVITFLLPLSNKLLQTKEQLTDELVTLQP